jgi:hypothetical protein
LEEQNFGLFENSGYFFQKKSFFQTDLAFGMENGTKGEERNISAFSAGFSSVAISQDLKSIWKLMK